MMSIGLIIANCIGLIMLVIIGVYFYVNEDTSQVTKENIEVFNMELDVQFNPDNLEELVGNSENVFIGEVIENVGSDRIDETLPRTQFQVKVVENIKGELRGNVIVNQHIGYFNYKGESGEEQFGLEKFEGQEFLQEGKTYIFSSLFQADKGWHNLHPVQGEVLINEDKRLLSVERIAYQEAFKNQDI